MAYHDHALSGGHLAFRPTHDKIRQKYWWPTMNRDVHKWCQECQACQRRKTAHNRPKLPTGHLPVERPFQRISVDLVEYKSESVSAAGVKMQNSPIYDGSPHKVHITDTNSKQIS